MLNQTAMVLVIGLVAVLMTSASTRVFAQPTLPPNEENKVNNALQSEENKVNNALQSEENKVKSAGGGGGGASGGHTGEGGSIIIYFY
jgi:hypothetical protein